MAGSAGDRVRGRLPESGAPGDVGYLHVGAGAARGAGDDDDVVHVLAHPVPLLADVADDDLYDVAGAERPRVLGPRAPPHHDRPAGAARLADEYERPVLLLDAGVGPAALGADHVGLGVVADLLVDVVRADLRLEDRPAPVQVARGPELLEQEVHEVLRVAPDLVDDVLEVPENGRLPLLDYVQLGELEPLVLLDGIGELPLGPVKHRRVIVLVHLDDLPWRGLSGALLNICCR